MNNKKHTALFLALLHSSTVSLKFMGSPTRTVTFYKYNNTIFNYTFEGTVVINQENLGKFSISVLNTKWNFFVQQFFTK